jgi:prepilin-type N-terminal cleavage/methylation domain-containing protein
MQFSNSSSTSGVTGAMALRGVRRVGLSPRPFTGVSAAGGVRPGVYAGLTTLSLIPNPQSPIPNHSRRGFTLVEMLIVIGIMLMLVTAAMTIMPAASEGRRTREAARGINVYLSTARNRAMETGRPCGVTFHCFVSGTTSIPCALNVDQCEDPPPYSGDTSTSMATVTWNGTGNTVSITFSDGALPNGFIRPGDMIELNGQGVLYTIAPTDKTKNINPADNNGYLKDVGGTATPLAATFDSSQGQIVPWGTTARKVLFRVLRGPMMTKAAAEAMHLPASTVVDLDFSGMSNQVNQLGCGQQDLTVMFSSTGAVDSVYYGSVRSSVTDPIYILIGKRERVATFTPLGQVPPATKQATQFTNLEDLNNLWVTINVQTGLINTEPVATGATTAAHDTYVAAKNAGATDAQAHLAAMIAATNAARALAVQGIGMGGK